MDAAQSALAATRALRRSPGFQRLLPGERDALSLDLDRLDAALLGRSVPPAAAGQHALHAAMAADPYAVPLETPQDLRGGGLAPRPGRPSVPGGPPRAPSQSGGGPPRPPATEVIGERARRALEAVDFPSFVAGLIQGTFTAIVDATAQQVRDYANLVADLSKSVDEFTRDRVTDNQARDWLMARHGNELSLVVPGPGEEGEPFLEPRAGADDSPAWLSSYGLAHEPLTPELAEGELLQAGRRALGEERLQTLATMVLMGINRIVVEDGQLRARLQFHARARERVSAEVVAQAGGQQMGIAGKQSGMQSGVSTMVSTVDVNTQADASVKADLVGEVAVRFRTQTFDLQNFADTRAIALINRHALQREPNAGAGSAAGASAPPAPSGGLPLPPPAVPAEEGAS